MFFIIKKNFQDLWEVSKKSFIMENGKRKRVIKVIRSFQEQEDAIQFAKDRLEKCRYGIVGIYNVDEKLPQVISKPRIRRNYRTIKRIKSSSNIDSELLKRAIAEAIVGS